MEVTMTDNGIEKPRSRHASNDDSGDLLPTPPDGGWGWIVVLGSFMIHIITDGVTYTFGIFFVEFVRYFNEGNGATSWIASILVGVTLCTGPISSSFVNKYGCRVVTIAGAILASVCLILSVFADSIYTLYATIGVGTGLGFGLIYLPAIVSVTCYFEKKRSFATGIAVCGSGLGTFVFAPITKLLIQEYRWRGAMLIIAGLVLNCVIFGALFRPLKQERSKRKRSWRSTDILDSQSLTKCNGTLEKSSEVVTNLLTDVRRNNSDHHLHLATLPPTPADIQRNYSTGNFSPHLENNEKKALCFSRSDGKYSEVARMALSQPVLIAVHESDTAKSSAVMFGSQGLHSHSSVASGLMYRPDILYRGSLVNIPQYRSNPRLYQDLMSRKPDEKHLESTTMCGCVPCSKETKDTLHEMLDFSLLKDVIFIMFTISNFCTSIGFNVPYVYIVAKAQALGITEDYASYLLSVIGIANTLGRIILGYISDKPYINRLFVYNICLTICGIGTALSAFCYDYSSLVFYAALFGFTIGAYVGLTSVVLVDLLGLDKLTNAFGLLLLFQGIASLIGPPIAGSQEIGQESNLLRKPHDVMKATEQRCLYDVMDSYDPGFYIAGSMIAISGMMLFAIPPLQRWLDNKECNKRTAANGCVIQDL